MGAETNAKAEELAAAVREIQERVRARHPSGSVEPGSITLADLLPVVNARDAAEAKVASIGSVNPRPPGLVNNLAQAVKRRVARALDWHVREQVEFNRGTMNCVQMLIEALNDVNRALVDLARRIEDVRAEMRSEFRPEIGAVKDSAQRLEDEARQLKDVRNHWAEWRQGWEHKLSVNEVQLLRSVADLQTAFQHRATLMESNFRGIVGSQHKDFEGALERAMLDIQKRLWADLEKIRSDYERLIHDELRVVRQRAAIAPALAVASPAPAAPAAPLYDALRFADRFRGSEDYVRRNLDVYLPFFEGRRDVLDIGCGRGEFLERMRAAGVAARGIDLSEDCVALCRHKGLAVEKADLFVYLADLAGASLDGIFCAQVVEHLPPERLPEFIRLSAEKLARGGVIALETPNPECLAIFATHFFLDPTHTRPIPSSLLVFYLEEFGFGRIEVKRLAPAADSMPALNSLPEDFRRAFFGGLDYAVLGARL